MTTIRATAPRQSLAGLPQFLRYLATFPTPDRVLDALRRGPLSHVDIPMAQLWRPDEHEVVSIAASNVPLAIIQRYSVVPRTIDLPIIRAIDSGTTVTVPVAGFGDAFLASIDADLWDDDDSAIRLVDLVNVPILHEGAVVGCLGLVTRSTWDPDGLGPVILEAVSGPLALWLTHPRTRLSPPTSGEREWSLALSARQKVVLSRIGEGASIPAIAAELGVSPASAKADLLRAMRSLRTNDRMVAVERAAALGLLDH